MIIKYVEGEPNYLQAFGFRISCYKITKVVLHGEPTLYLARYMLLKLMTETMYIHGACYLHNAGINEKHN